MKKVVCVLISLVLLLVACGSVAIPAEYEILWFGFNVVETENDMPNIFSMIGSEIVIYRNGTEYTRLNYGEEGESYGWFSVEGIAEIVGERVSLSDVLQDLERANWVGDLNQMREILGFGILWMAELPWHDSVILSARLDMPAYMIEYASSWYGRGVQHSLLGGSFLDGSQPIWWGDYLEWQAGNETASRSVGDFLRQVQSGVGYACVTTWRIASEPTEPTSTDIIVTLNGTPMTFDVPPMIVNGRTMVPFRAIFTALGMDVDWDEVTRIATGTSYNLEIELTIDSYIAYINGNAETLDASAMIYGGRTLVPARFVAEATGANVDWNENTRTVIITTN